MQDFEMSGLYIENLFGNREVAIDFDPVVWQSIIWDSALAIYHQKHYGGYSFSEEDVLKERLADNEGLYADVDYSKWTRYYIPSQNSVYTDRVISITQLWKRVADQLSLLNISYDYDSQHNRTHSGMDAGLCETIVKYMQALDTAGYVIDLRTGSECERSHSYKLRV